MRELPFDRFEESFRSDHVFDLIREIFWKDEINEQQQQLQQKQQEQNASTNCVDRTTAKSMTGDEKCDDEVHSGMKRIEKKVLFCIFVLF